MLTPNAYFSIGTDNSRNMNLEILGEIEYNSGTYRVEETQINGRIGDLVNKQGSISNVELNIEGVLRGDSGNNFDMMLDKLKQWLLNRNMLTTPTGEALTFSFIPSKQFRLLYVKEVTGVRKSPVYGTVNIVLVISPYYYNSTGLTEVILTDGTNNTQFNNTSGMFSEPIIRVTCTVGGTVNLIVTNGTTSKTYGLDMSVGTMILNSETFQAILNGSENYGLVSPSDFTIPFPQFFNGMNKVNWTTTTAEVSQVVVTPRYRFFI